MQDTKSLDAVMPEFNSSEKSC